jgi:hypothetical protein
MVVLIVKMNSLLDIEHDDQNQLNHMDNEQMYKIHVENVLYNVQDIHLIFLIKYLNVYHVIELLLKFLV